MYQLLYNWHFPGSDPLLECGKRWPNSGEGLTPWLRRTGMLNLSEGLTPRLRGGFSARKSPVQMHRAKDVPTRTRTATTGVGGRYSIQLSYKNPFGFTNLYIIRHWPEKYKERMRR